MNTNVFFKWCRTSRLWQVGQARKLFVSVWSASQSFLFCNYFFFLIAKSKRFGGLSKQTQVFKYNTLSPICYSIYVKVVSRVSLR